MDFNPATSPTSSTNPLSRSYPTSGGVGSAYESSYGLGARIFSGTQANIANSISNHEHKTSQTEKGPKTLSVACESSGGSDNIEFQSTCIASMASAMGQKIDQKAQAEDTYQVTALSASANKQKVGAVRQGEAKASSQREGNWKFFGTSVNQNLKVDDVVEKIDSGQLWVVNSRRRNGIIVMREFHAEFAGPGAAVGGDLDSGIVKIIPIGNLSLLEPDSHEEHQNAIKIRLQWIRLTQNFTDQASPDDRARMILEQFKTYFDQATVDLVPDEAFAMLVGVLPQTIHRVRAGFVW